MAKDAKVETASAKRACLTSRDIVDLLEGRMVTAFGQEFTYDGGSTSTEVVRIWTAAESLRRRVEGDRPPPTMEGRTRR